MSRKFQFVFIFLFTLISSPSISKDWDREGDHYQCEYPHKGKKFIFQLVQTGEKDYLMGGGDMDYATSERVIKDKDEILLLANGGEVDGAPSIRVIFVDKYFKRFSMTVLVSPIYRELYEGGIWGDVVGECETLLVGPMLGYDKWKKENQ